MEAQFRAKMPLGWYTVTSSYDQILGLCDTPTNKGMGIVVPADGSQQAMAVTIHELLHACGVPDRALHKIDEKGRDCTDHVARVMWKLGWRQITAGERDIINGIRSAARGE